MQIYLRQSQNSHKVEAGKAVRQNGSCFHISSGHQHEWFSIGNATAGTVLSIHKSPLRFWTQCPKLRPFVHPHPSAGSRPAQQSANKHGFVLPKIPQVAKILQVRSDSGELLRNREEDTDTVQSRMTIVNFRWITSCTVLIFLVKIYYYINAKIIMNFQVYSEDSQAMQSVRSSRPGLFLLSLYNFLTNFSFLFPPHMQTHREKNKK